MEKKHYQYTRKCLVCGTEVTYNSTPIERPWNDFYEALLGGVIRMFPNSGVDYTYCEDCKCFTRQVLWKFDSDE